MITNVLIALLVPATVICEETKSANHFEKVLTGCLVRYEMFKCLKIEAVKVANRAISLKKFNIMDGISFVGDNQGQKLFLNDSKLEKLNSEQLDDLLSETSTRFFQTHQLEIKIPSLVNAQSGAQSDSETAEARKRKGGGGGGGAALYWALAIKGTFLAMAYKGIAVMSGMALIMGKMALLLSAILGLKKLVSNGQEQTTIEIIKKPKETHTFTSSHEEEEFHKGHGYDRGDSDVTKTRFKTYFP